MNTAAIISLGCPRNLVDSEIIAGSLKKSGFKIVDIKDGAEVCVINTCSFIEEARKESIDAILEAVELKKEDRIGRLIVCGCLPQLYKGRLAKSIPEIDLILGTSDFAQAFASFMKTIRGKGERSLVSTGLDYLYDENSPRFRLTPRHYAYVKVSEGCSNLCSYCLISRLRGPFRSRTAESVVREVKGLAKSGNLKEINLIGQDTTLFGIDRYKKSVFPELLKRICAIDTSPEWVRILYTHPAHYSDELIKTIRDEKKICKYLDLPVQHISNKVLKAMNRLTTKKDIINLITNLRKNVPGLTLRTSIIVGFPGEGERDFKELLNFIRETRFERLGAFIYSREDGTKAARLSKQIPEKVKKERLDVLMELAKKISAERNRSFVGSTLNVLIDEKIDGENNKFLARTEGDAPEIDNSVYVTGGGIKPGDFCSVRITDALEYDLIGEAV